MNPFPCKDSPLPTRIEATYYDMLEKFQKGRISEEEWQAFCQQILLELMEKNKDIFLRLKNR
jgi:hypothetical protein